MCGIVGYIGHREAYPIVLKGLKGLNTVAMIVQELQFMTVKKFSYAKPKGKLLILNKNQRRNTHIRYTGNWTYPLGNPRYPQ